MTVAISFLIGAALVGQFAPGFLARLVVGGADPLATLVAWLASAIAVVLTTAAGVVVLLLPDHGLTALHACWSLIQHGTTPRIEAVGGIAGTSMVIALAYRLVATTLHTVRRRARARAEHLETLRIAARRDGSTLWLAREEPLAFSLAGKPGVIVATEGLTEHLSQAQLNAVFAHERAHLTGRHHLLVAFADALAHALPFVPLFKLSPAVLRELVELAADSAAARACGPDAVRAALIKVSQHGVPTTALGMSGSSIDLRLARLRTGRCPAGRARQLLTCTFAGATALALPAGAVLSAIALTCLA
ncbi:M56 family metallopeptidase [Lentzea sp. NPDC051838]|uniref:M56 family metallopeptidase n=1 Tax=Lentzea sp. NPDC051838 TaxID=3154849 RepID=UPI0034210587